MSGDRWSELIELLDKKNVIFLDGLSNAEVGAIQQKYGFQFPPDLRDFFQTALPKGYRFFDWRSNEGDQEAAIGEMLAWPLIGILFDVEQNDFWLPEWGARPETEEQRRVIVEKIVANAPRLIPIYGHRYMPDQPCEEGNPILSVYQTDIIYYGFDLDDYLRHEFDLPCRRPWPETMRRIEFWDVNRWQSIR